MHDPHCKLRTCIHSHPPLIPSLFSTGLLLPSLLARIPIPRGDCGPRVPRGTHPPTPHIRMQYGEAICIQLVRDQFATCHLREWGDRPLGIWFGTRFGTRDRFGIGWGWIQCGIRGSGEGGEGSRPGIRGGRGVEGEGGTG